MAGEQTPTPEPAPRPVSVALVLAHFPKRHVVAFKYFVLLLNRLQQTFEFAFYDPPVEHALMKLLRKRWAFPWTRHSKPNKESGPIGRNLVDPDDARPHLVPFAETLKAVAEERIKRFDLAPAFPQQVIIISRATLSNYHYLIRKQKVSLLALGEWDRSMAPPSAAEFLQLVVLRAAYSATEKGAWNTIHLGTRSCVFDFTRNLQDTRMMTLVGLGVCGDCENALKKDGFVRSPAELRFVAEKTWLGKRSEPGTPANIMARFGYDLYFTRGFTSTFAERLRQLLEEDAAKELIKLVYLVVGTALLIWWRLKKP